MKAVYEQFIADLYHCSGCWGEKVTEQEMKCNLEQWQREGIDDCPPVESYRLCAAYWNLLCDWYPT